MLTFLTQSGCGRTYDRREPEQVRLVEVALALEPVQLPDIDRRLECRASCEWSVSVDVLDSGDRDVADGLRRPGMGM